MSSELVSHEPGEADVSTMEPGQPFEARPNFHHLEKCGRPCWLPGQPRPEVGPVGTAVTVDWPCEQYGPHDTSRGTACYAEEWRDGDWLQVIGQVKGKLVTNDNPEDRESSDVWNVVEVSPEHLKPGAGAQLSRGPSGGYIVYFADVFMGNTGWHDIPWKEDCDD